MNEAFYYENAKDSRELSEKILEVLENKPSKEKLEEIAKKLEKAYNEEEIAKKYIKEVKKILEER